jgi:hypothetical protein
MDLSGICMVQPHLNGLLTECSAIQATFSFIQMVIDHMIRWTIWLMDN